MHKDDVINDLISHEGDSLFMNEIIEKKVTGTDIALDMIYIGNVLKVLDKEVIFKLTSDQSIN